MGKPCNKCGGTDCEYYKSNKGTCISCLRAYQRAYRLSDAGKSSHLRNRSTELGLAGQREREARQRAKGNDKLPKAKWVMYNRVNRDTLSYMIHPECTNCVENMDGNGSQSCSVAQGDENIRLCPVWQEFKRTGIHPLPKPSDYDDESPYGPDQSYFEEFKIDE